ncbi:MAG: single-stranded DNA-binding protein [Clostridia bacterium]|nr:single-stranded DNA-binding protein [Clostridia bacterium]
MNKCILIGNLTRDPELTTTASGVSLCRFSIAVNRAYANQNGEREADFFNIVTWRGLAENCSKYLSKGRKVAIVGNIQNRSYEDKDGNKRFSTDIVAEDVEFLTAMGSSDGERPSASKKVDMAPVDNDDLPF